MTPKWKEKKNNGNFQFENLYNESWLCFFLSVWKTPFFKNTMGKNKNLVTSIENRTDSIWIAGCITQSRNVIVRRNERDSECAEQEKEKKHFIQKRIIVTAQTSCSLMSIRCSAARTVPSNNTKNRESMSRRQ